ncbi:hypothetical protein SAMN05216464_12536 [Mucilaginibacter pineti]|uniref:Uncharacterized protein n=1 Tax=Mucilaginibacter pineti TaxID=1391627 RepID=A0A1G7N951_9SPHI|nr:hypothetical protein SAMN05216464_12536 [Mucilaginibacter pineti]
MKIQNQNVKLNRKTAFTFKKNVVAHSASVCPDPPNSSALTPTTGTLNCTV